MVGDAIRITDGNKTFDLVVKDCEPQEAILTTDCDLEVDFSFPEQG
jgi:hypothetical protein